jgi:cation transport protein ChaC
MPPQALKLTAELVRRVHRHVVDSGPEDGISYFAEAEFDRIVRELLAEHPVGKDVWLFAYGSLIWKPEVDHIEERPGVARGWQRSFCIRVNRWRGTLDCPGLVMTLDRGGDCRGLVFRLAGATALHCLGKLVRRELDEVPPSQVPR